MNNGARYDSVVTHLLPGSDLLFVPYARRICRPPLGSARNSSCLGDEEGPRDGRPLRVVLDRQVGGDPTAVGSASREWCKDYTMTKRDLPNPDGLEEGARGGRMLRYVTHSYATVGCV